MPSGLSLCLLASLALIAAVLLWGRRDQDRVLTCRPGQHFELRSLGGKATIGCYP